MAFFKVKKRNGSIATFEKSKIEKAIKKAVEAAGGKDFSGLEKITDLAIALTEKKVGKNIPDVEILQDSVEDALIKSGHNEVAKLYILYRQKRSESRQDKNVVIEVAQSMNEYLDQSDWRVQANSNIGFSLGGMILNISGKITANYWLSHIYTPEIGNLHRNGDYHIHDLDMFCGYCAGWSLRQLLEEGFNGVPNKIESDPPKNLQAAVNQMINFLGTNQNEWAGAQAFSSFDTYTAPFVHKKKIQIEESLDKIQAKFDSPEAKKKYIYDETYTYVLQQMQNFVFGLNTPSRWGTQTPFTNITLDLTCPEDLKDKALFLGGVDKGPYKKKYGELEEEMKILNRALVEVYISGDSKGRVFTFPIPTYNITEDFPWDDPETDGIFEMTAKYGIPYFQNFIGSQFNTITKPDGTKEKVRNPNAYTPGSVRSMCCRLQLDLKELQKRGNGLFGSAEMTGSIGVVTINLPRIGYNFKGDKEGFKNRIRYLMDNAKISLEMKRKELLKHLDAGLYPYTKRYLGHFRNHFSTIGLNGMNEAILNFTNGQEDVTTKEGIAFSIDILEFMRGILKEYQEETGNLYNLEATPAEGTTYRFAKEDKKQLPGIIQAGTEDAPYYTNSTQLPVDFTDDVFEALDYQDELQCKYTGGTVLHVYLGEKVTSVQATKDLIKKIISNYRLPYITLSPTFSICPKHGYIVGEHDFCPICDEILGYKGEEFNLLERDKYTSDASKMEKIKEKTI